MHMSPSLRSNILRVRRTLPSYATKGLLRDQGGLDVALTHGTSEAKVAEFDDVVYVNRQFKSCKATDQSVQCEYLEI